MPTNAMRRPSGDQPGQSATTLSGDTFREFFPFLSAT
jgi:hypothetical protein